MSPRRKVLPAEPVALKTGTTLLTCGDGGSGQLGHGTAHAAGKKPRRVDQGLPAATKSNRILQIAAGDMHSMVLYENGDVYIAGCPDNGTIPPLKDNKPPEGDIDVFTKVPLPKEMIAKTGKPVRIAAGGGFSCVLTDAGSVIAWGYIHADGIIDHFPVVDAMRRGPVVLFDHDELGDHIVQVSCGCTHVVALSRGRKVYTFGDATQGQLGRAAPNRPQRKRVSLNTGAASYLSLPRVPQHKVCHPERVFATEYGTVVVTDNPAVVFVAGLNNYGQLGVPPSASEVEDGEDDKAKYTLGLCASEHLAAATPDGPAIRQAAGDHHTVTLDDAGAVWCLGRNVDNRLGVGSESTSWRCFRPQRVQLSAKAVTVAANNASSIAVLDNGRAYAWGLDTSGQCGCGVGDADVLDTPEQCISKHLDALRIVQVAMGSQHSLFLAEPEEPVDEEEEDEEEKETNDEAMPDAAPASGSSDASKNREKSPVPPPLTTTTPVANQNGTVADADKDEDESATNERGDESAATASEQGKGTNHVTTTNENEEQSSTDELGIDESGTTVESTE